MKHFLKNSLLFFLLVIVLSYPLDVVISSQLKKSNYAWGEFNTWNDIYKGEINSEIVIYGSSRAWRHIDSELIEKNFQIATYNLGIDGHNFWLQHLRHKTLLQYNKKPKYIIMSIDIWSLQRSGELYNSEQFLPYMLFNTDIIDYTSSYEGFTSSDYYFPLIRYIGNRNAIVQSIENSVFFPPIKPKRKKGYEGFEGDWNNDLLNAKKEKGHYVAKLDTDLIELFNDFLLECNKNGIKVILVYTPEHIEGQQFVKNRKEIIALFDNFSKRHEILFLDYSNDEICTRKDYFYNASHLNKSGAERFTNILINDLKREKIIVTHQ